MSQPERLYQLLPALYRRRDLELGQPLRALMAVLESELQALEDDVEGLHEDAFIETCQSWVVPYLADLLGIRALGDAAYAGAHPRAQVADVLALRQRKGSPLSIERGTRDVLGWPSRLVELFRFLSHTQNVALVRPEQGGTFDVRRGEDAAADVPRAPFAEPGAFRTVDVRRVTETGGSSDEGGLYNVPHLSLFLWRLRPYRLADGPTAADGTPDRRFRLDPLGRDLELFHAPEPDPALIRQAAEGDLPVRVTRRRLDRDLQSYAGREAAADAAVRAADSVFYGPDRSLWIKNDGTGVPPLEVVSRNLDAWGVPGVLSGALTAPVGLEPPEIEVTHGGNTQQVVVAQPPTPAPLTQKLRLPLTLEEARETLEAGLQAASVDPTFSNARVYLLDDRLLLLPGVAADNVTVTSTATDALTAGRLRLDTGTAVQGRLSASFPAPFPVFSPTPALDVTVGTDGPYRARLARPPASASDLRTLLEQAIREANPSSPSFRRARVLLDTNDRLLVLAGDVTQAPTLAAAGDPAAWDPLTGSSMVTGGLLSEPLTPFPALRAVRVTLGDLGPAVAALPGVSSDLLDAAALLEAAIRAAGMPPDFRRARVVLLSDAVPSPRLLVLSGEPGDRVLFAPAEGPGGLQETATWTALGLDALVDAPGALSGVLDPFPRLRRPALRVTLGGRLPRPATLEDVPSSLEEARLFLGGALRAAHDSPTFQEARVRVPAGESRLLVMPGGSNDPVAFDLGEDDPFTAADLRLRSVDGATQVLGLLSGSLAVFPALGTAPLQVSVTITDATGVATTATASLSTVPTDLDSAATELQTAIQGAGLTPSFTNAQVVAVDDRLLVFSGVDREAVSVASVAGDSTAVALKLTSVSATLTEGLWSGDLSSFPALRAAPHLELELGAASGTVRLPRLPRDLRHAVELLQTAAAGVDPDARVFAHEGHLLLLAGDPSQPVTVRTVPVDPGAPADPYDLVSAHALDLAWTAALDPQLGRVLFALDVTVGVVRGHHTYGFSADLGGGPYDRRLTLADAADFSAVLEVEQSGAGGAFTTLGAALTEWENQGKPDTILRVLDSELYPEAPRIELAPDARLVIEAADGEYPVVAWADLPDNLEIRGAEGAALTVSGLLLDGTVELETAMDLRFLHSTLRPRPGRPSLSYTSSPDEAEELEVHLSASITGALALPDTLACLELADSVLDAAGEVLDATPWPVLISDALTEPPDLGSLLEVEVTLGPESGTARLRNVPANLRDLRGLLQAALQAIPSGDPDRFAMAQVLLVGSRLLVRSGNLGETVSFSATARDSATVEKAALLSPPAQPLDGLLSGDLSGFLPFTLPQLLVTFDELDPRLVTLAAEPQSLGQVASLLQGALRASGAEPTFTAAEVEVLTMGGAGQERLLIRPGVAGDAVRLAATPGDPDSLGNFNFDSPTSVAGVFSDVLGAFPLFQEPEVQVIVGGGTPETVTLTTLPTTVSDAATELNARLAADAAGLGFTGNEVLAFAGRLLVLSPNVAQEVEFAVTGADSTSAAELGLLLPDASPQSGTAEEVQGLLSNVLDPGTLVFPRPMLDVTLAGGAALNLTLERSPEDLADAGRLLEAAVAAAEGDDRFTALVLDSRLLLRRDGDAVVVTAAAGDTTTAPELGLVVAAGDDFDSRDLTGGLLSGEINPFPDFVLPQMEVTLGTTGPLAVIFERFPEGTGTSLAQDTAGLLERALRAASSATAFRGARVAFSNDLLVILPGEPVAEILFATNEADASTAVELALEQPPATAVTGLLSGVIAPFPELAQPELLATIGGFTETVTLASNPNTLALAATALETALRSRPVAPFYTQASVLVVVSRLLVLIGGGSGSATFATTPTDTATATGLGLTPANGADAVACRLSGDLSAFGGFQQPEVQVTYDPGGTSTPFTASLGANLPFNRTVAAGRLQTGIQNQGFSNTTVTEVGTRLFLDPGTDTDNVITGGNTGNDTTTSGDLALTPAGGAEPGLLGAALTEPLSLTATVTATTPAVQVTVGGDVVTAILTSSPTTIAAAATALQAAIQAADTTGTTDAARFTGAQVRVRGSRLFVVPGGTGGRVAAAAAAGDATTAGELLLDAGNGAWGLLSGDLSSFAQLTLTPEVGYTVGGGGQPVNASGTVTFTTVPANLTQVQSALNAGIPEALVELDSSGNRLRACPLQPGVTTVDFTDVTTTPSAPAVASALLLTDATGGQMLAGTMSGNLVGYSGLPLPPLDLLVAIGTGGTRTVTLLVAPTDIDSARSELEGAIRTAGAADTNASFQQASVVHLDDQLLILPGIPEESVVVASAPAAPTLAEDLKLTFAVGATQVSGLSSGNLESFPQLSVVPEMNLTITGGTTAGPYAVRLANVPRGFDDLRALLELAIRNVNVGLATPVPVSFQNATVERIGGRLLITSGDQPTDTVLAEDTGQGPATAAALALDAAVASGAAGRLSDVLVLPVLTDDAPEVDVTVGATTSTVPLGPKPRTLSEAAVRLEAAIPPAISTRVRIVAGHRLLLVADSGEDIGVDAAAGDSTTASELALRPPAAEAFTGLRRGLLSADLSTFPDLSTAGEPWLFLRMGAAFRVVRLGAVPETLQQTRDLLQAALNAETWPSFASSQVFALEDGTSSQLLILPGPVVPWSVFFGSPVEFFGVTGSTFAQDLGLTVADGATADVSALLSGSLGSFPVLSVTPRLNLTIDDAGGTPQTGRVVLRRQPADQNLAETATLLQEAIRTAVLLDGSPLPSEFTAAEVRLLGDPDPADATPEARLLLLPGPGSGGQRTTDVVAANLVPAVGPNTASLLQLTTAAGAAQVNGLLSEDLSRFKGLRGIVPAVRVTIGDAGPVRVALPTIPTNINDTADALELGFDADPRVAFRNTKVVVFESRLLITPGVAEEITFAADPDNPGALAQLGLDDPTPAGGLLSDLFVGGYTPRVNPQVSLTLNALGPVTVELTGRPADLDQAAQLLEDAINATATFSGVTVEVLEAHLLVRQSGLTGDLIVFDAVTGVDETTVYRLRLDPASAEPADGLLSGDLAVFPSFGARPAVRLTLGNEGPHRAELPFLPGDLDEARTVLEQAVRQAHNSPAFLLARVLLVTDPAADGRLVVVPGTPVPVEALADPDTPEVAAGLGLVGSGVQRVQGLLSGELPAQLTLSAPSPEVAVAMALGGVEDGPHDVSPVPASATLADVAAALESALQGVVPTSSDFADAFGAARVVLPNPAHLLVLPGADGAAVGFRATAADDTTLGELRLGLSRAVGTGITEQVSGPPLSLSRVTVFGRLHVRELPLASEVLFTAPVQVEHREVGCVRFAYLPPGSTVPRCYRCQPELALSRAVREALEERARQLGLTSIEDLPEAERLAVETRQRNLLLARLEPRFTSTRHADAGYAQLASDAADELAAGAEDGSELGAFHLLQQPKRRKLLRTLLEEYLRFGLEAGIFPVT